MRRFLVAAPLLLAAPLALAQPSQFGSGAAPAPSAPAQPAPATPPTKDGAATTAPQRQAGPERDAAVAAARDLLEANGALQQAEAAMQQTLHQMAAGVAQQSGQPVARVIEIFDTVLMPEFRARLPELGEAMATSWAGHLSAADLRALAEFYRSPLGQRLREATAAVTAETMEFGARWGQQVGLDAIQKHREALRARGLRI